MLPVVRDQRYLRRSTARQRDLLHHARSQKRTARMLTHNKLKSETCVEPCHKLIEVEHDSSAPASTASVLAQLPEAAGLDLFQSEAKNA